MNFFIRATGINGYFKLKKNIFKKKKSDSFKRQFIKHTLHLLQNLKIKLNYFQILCAKNFMLKLHVFNEIGFCIVKKKSKKK